MTDIELLREFEILIREGSYFYTNYLKEGKPYRIAKRLRFHNEKIYDFCQSNMNIFASSFIVEFTALKLHLEDWMSCWDLLDSSRQFDSDSVFVFTSCVRFPKSEVQRCIDRLNLVNGGKE